MKFLRKLLPILFYGSIWGMVIYFVEPPASWPSATTTQILSFFIPLLLTVTFLINFILNYLPHSFIAALGILLMLVLYAINQLTAITAGIIILITTLLIKIFPRVRLPRLRLTPLLKILRIHKSEGNKRQ